MDCLISEHGVNMLNGNIAKQLPTSTQECEGVNCVSYESLILAHVKICVNAAFICQWKIYLRSFGEFNTAVVIREMHLSQKASCMEFVSYFVRSLCIFFLFCIFHLCEFHLTEY